MFLTGDNFVNKPKQDENMTEKKKPGRPKGAKRRKQSGKKADVKYCVAIL